MEKTREDQPVDRSTFEKTYRENLNMRAILALALVIFLIGFALSRGSFG